MEAEDSGSNNGDKAKGPKPNPAACLIVFIVLMGMAVLVVRVVEQLVALVLAWGWK